MHSNLSLRGSFAFWRAGVGILAPSTRRIVTTAVRQVSRGELMSAAPSSDMAVTTDVGQRSSASLRYRVFTLVGLGIAVQYWIRSSISVAVVLAPDRYGWRGPWAALSLSAFFVGYMPGQIPWSLFASKISPRLALSASVLISSLATCAVAGALRSGPTVCCFRVVTGLAQAATFPCVYALMNEWAEPSEISRAIGLAKCIGENGGALLGLAGSELILRARLVLPFGGPTIGGLQLVFLAPATAGTLWTIFFLILVPPRTRSSRRRDDSSASSVPSKAPAFAPPWRGLLGWHRSPVACYLNHATASVHCPRVSERGPMDRPEDPRRPASSVSRRRPPAGSPICY